MRTESGNEGKRESGREKDVKLCGHSYKPC